MEKERTGDEKPKIKQAVCMSEQLAAFTLRAVRRGRDQSSFSNSFLVYVK
jgi:hypothetical protein